MIICNVAKNQTPDVYFRFLNLAKTLSESSSKEMDSPAKLLLETICLHTYSTKGYLTVSEIISMSHIGSPATLHARIKKMVAAGYLTLDIQKDARIKKVIPASKACKYFEQLSHNLVAAVMGS